MQQHLKHSTTLTNTVHGHGSHSARTPTEARARCVVQAPDKQRKSASSYMQTLRTGVKHADSILRVMGASHGAKRAAAESGKPENVQEKMVEGAVAKFAKENALLSQILVHDNKTPIEQVVAQAGKEAGKPIVLKDYVRFQLGEGIEKEESDFAAEVAAAVKG